LLLKSIRARIYFLIITVVVGLTIITSIFSVLRVQQQTKITFQESSQIELNLVKNHLVYFAQNLKNILPNTTNETIVNAYEDQFNCLDNLTTLIFHSKYTAQLAKETKKLKTSKKTNSCPLYIYYNPNLTISFLPPKNVVKNPFILQLSRNNITLFSKLFHSQQNSNLTINSISIKNVSTTLEANCALLQTPKNYQLFNILLHKILIMKEMLNDVITNASEPDDFIFIFTKDGIIDIQPSNIDLTWLQNLPIKQNLLRKLKTIADHNEISNTFSEKLSVNNETTKWSLSVVKFKPYNWYIVRMQQSKNLNAITYRLIKHLIITNTIIMLIGLLIAFWIVNNLTSPIAKLSKLTKELPLKNFKFSPKDIDELLLITTQQDEIGNLSQAFLDLQKSLKKYIKESIKTTHQKQRMDQELNIAKNIQVSLLPEISGLYNAEIFNLFALVEPARKVGGDFYNFFYIDKKHLCFMLGDVSDKGIPAAIFMAVTKTLLEAEIKSYEKPGAMLSHVNNLLIHTNKYNMFATIFLGILNLDTGIIEYTNAGHLPPIITRYNKSSDFLENKPQPVLGVFKDVQYKTHTLTLKSNDMLFLYTDGVTEAANKNNEMFSESRLLQFVRANNIISSRILIRKLLTTLLLFTKGVASQADDIAMLAICYNKKIIESEYIWLELPAVIDSVEKFRNFISQALIHHQINEALKNDILFVIEEAVVNIMNYAFTDHHRPTIKIGCKISNDYDLCLQIIDGGKPFNPLQTPPPTYSKNIKNLKRGGFGCHFIKQLSGEADYQYIDGKNLLTIIFYTHRT
jgi:phosphoserine phosphatase RsbU/P